MTDDEDEDEGPRALRNFRPVHDMGPPDLWGPSAVRRRLIEGARIAIFTAGRVGPAGYGSGLPSEMIEAMGIGGEADRRRISINASPRQMTLAEQANGWATRYLADQPGMRRVLALFVFCRAYRISFVKMCKARGWSRSTAYTRRDQALRVIAAGLNQDRVRVEV